jgi:Flp pilus assembly protein TadB
MHYSSLLTWWMISISWCALFLIAVSTYLYLKTREPSGSSGILGKAKDFIFVWILACLLILYILTINNSSSIIFIAGNVIVEIVLVVYTMRNRGKKT